MQTVSRAAQQKDNLCGPFQAARILVESGFSQWSGEPIDQDLIAFRASTALPLSSGRPEVPPGATSLQDYRFQLPVTSPEESGTSPVGLIRAIEAASDGRLRCIPIHGDWTASLVEQLVVEAPQLGARLIANLRTGKLWGSRPTVQVVMDELAGRPVQDPPPDWDVGHFIELVMLIRGTRHSLVIVRDSYPNLGWDGHHAQPPRTLAAALLRGDGREGGVLGIVPRASADAVAALAFALGLEIGAWNNGSRS